MKDKIMKGEYVDLSSTSASYAEKHKFLFKEDQLSIVQNKHKKQTNSLP